VGKLVSIVGGRDILYRAAGIAAPEALQLIVSADYSAAFLDLQTARWELRQLHLENLAFPISSESRSRNGLMIDTDRLLRAAGGSRQVTSGPVAARKSDSTATRRFYAAHAAAHLILSSDCAWPQISAHELDANDLAGALLAPRGLMIQALKAAFASPVDPWSPDAGSLVEIIADKLLVPGWVALRRIGVMQELNYYLDFDDEEN
jgi:hypothetical protein